ncbi:MAG TPA: hypothetical protein VFI22_02685 [Thermomicrobiales bacterium]|nr:hypothetical protein [Thermomicrobiales bacterium]
MDDDPAPTPRHESVDHIDPTAAGLMDPTGDDAPGTGIMGDETVVRDIDPNRPPGIYPGPAAHIGGRAHPGPTPAAAEDRAERDDWAR